MMGFIAIPLLWLFFAISITLFLWVFLIERRLRGLPRGIRFVASMALAALIIPLPVWDDQLVTAGFRNFCSRHPYISQKYAGPAIKGVEIQGDLSVFAYSWSRMFSFVEFQPEQIAEGSRTIPELDQPIYRLTVEKEFSKGCETYLRLATRHEFAGYRKPNNANARRRFAEETRSEMNEYLGGGCIAIEAVDSLQSEFVVVSERQKFVGLAAYQPISADRLVLQNRRTNDEYFLKRYRAYRGLLFSALAGLIPSHIRTANECGYTERYLGVLEISNLLESE